MTHAAVIMRQLSYVLHLHFQTRDSACPRRMLSNERAHSRLAWCSPKAAVTVMVNT